MSIFRIDENIARAKTLDTDFYTRPEYFEESKEKLFARSWQFAGSAPDDVKENGSVHPFTLLKDFLNEPLMLSRDAEGKINCLSNVCTHRGNIVAESDCKVNHLRCRYHGRQFGLDGKIISMPEFKEVENFPSPGDDLPSLPLFQWRQWLFTSLKPEIKGELFFVDMMQRMNFLLPANFIFHPELSKEYMVNAHWALYCENYLEGFHIPYVHASLNAVIDFKNYSTELFRYSNLQLGIAKEGEACFDLPASSLDYGKRIAAYYFFVFPNLMFNFYPWGLSLNIVQPLAPDKTKISFFTYVYDESKLGVGAGAGLEKVEKEDEEVVENVQRGIRSRFYQHGRYSVSREQGTHHFHRLIAEWMK